MTEVASVAPVQRKMGGAEVAGDAAVDATAARSGKLIPGGGDPAFPAAVRAKMEASFGADFSAVRIHQDGQAAAIGARAFTRGTNIHFAPGQYDPHSRRGQELLGHELAHVVQQSRGQVKETMQAKGVGINEDDALEHEADVLGAKAASGEQVADGGEKTSIAAMGDARAVQRMKLLPFDRADQSLVTFLNTHANGIAEGETVQSTSPSRIKVGERLVIIGHGNGFELSSHEGPDSSRNFTKFDYAELAVFLAEKVLPDGYRGDIVVWSCSSARPWGQIEGIRQQLGPKEQDKLDFSFIKGLEEQLKAIEGRHLKPTVHGSIGFAGLDKPWQEARVYESEKWLIEQTSVPARDGFISSKQMAPLEFYKMYEKLMDDDESDVEFGGGHQIVEEMPTQPTRRSARQRAKKERVEEKMVEETPMEEEAPQQTVPQNVPQHFQQPVPQHFQQPVHQPGQIVGWGYEVQPRTPGSLQDRLHRQHFGGDERAYQEWKRRNHF